MDTGVGFDELGFRMYWSPTAAVSDNTGQYRGATEHLDCDATGIINNGLHISDPDGTVMVDMDLITVPEGVCSAEKPWYVCLLPCRESWWLTF